MRILGRKKLLRGERCQTQSSGEEGERVFWGVESWEERFWGAKSGICLPVHWPLVFQGEKTCLGPGLCPWLGWGMLRQMGKLEKQALWSSQLYELMSQKALWFDEMIKKNAWLLGVGVEWWAVEVGTVKKKRHSLLVPLKGRPQKRLQELFFLWYGGASWHQVTALVGTQLYLAGTGPPGFGSLFCNDRGLGTEGILENHRSPQRMSCWRWWLASTGLSISVCFGGWEGRVTMAVFRKSWAEGLREQIRTRAMLIQLTFPEERGEVVRREKGGVGLQEKRESQWEGGQSSAEG